MPPFIAVAMLVASLCGAAGAADEAPAVTELHFEGASTHSASTVEVRCPGASPVRASGTTTFRFVDLPAGVCTAQVTGATRARFRPVIAGETYDCMAGPSSLYCNAYIELAPVEANVPPPALQATVHADAPARSSGTVRVTLEQGDLALWGLVVCPGGARLKAEFVSGETRFTDVPDEDCMLALKGGSPVRFSGVRPGDHIVCASAGGSILCRDKVVSAPPPSPSDVARTQPGPREQAPVVPPGAGELEVVLTDPTASSWVYVQCPSGFRERATFVSGRAAMEGVPDESCTLSFKGGTPARFSGVAGGQRLTCSLSGVIARCEQ